MKPFTNKQQFDDMAEEFENERAHASCLTENQLEAALSAMRSGKSPEHFSTDPEFQEALRLHVLTSNAEVNDDFATGLQQRILERAGAEKRMAAAQHTPWYQRRMLIPFASATGVAVVVFGVVAVMNSQPGTNGAVEVAREIGTTGESQGSSSNEPAEPSTEETNQNAPSAENSQETNESSETSNATSEEPTEETNTDTGIDATVAVATVSESDIELLLADMESDVAVVESTQAELAEYDAAVAEIESDVKAVTSIASTL